VRRVGAALLLLAACAEAPETVVVRAAEATLGRQDVTRWLHPDYADPEGGLDQLLADLDRWAERYPTGEVELGRPTREAGPSRRRVRVQLPFRTELKGSEPWRVRGQLDVALVRTWGYRIRSGWFTELRQAQTLFDSLRRAASPGEVKPLLHPEFRTGEGDLTDRAEYLTRLGARHPFGCAWEAAAGVTLRQARLEQREARAHLDLFLRLPDPGGPIPRRLRLELAPSAGRLRVHRGLP
jgi:hypothetical protein